MTKRNILVILFCSLYGTSLFGNPDFPPAHVISTDTLDYVWISNSSWQILEDAKGEWTIEQVSQLPVSAGFRIDSTSDNHLGYSTHVYWLRCRLRNGMNRRANIYFLPQYADRIDYFFSGDNKTWNQETTGYLFPAGSKNIFQSSYCVPLSLDAGQEIMIYIRLYINYFYYTDYKWPSTIHLNYGSQAKFINSYSETIIFPAMEEALLFGILIIAVIYNLLFFWTVRERLYLYFSLFLLCFAIHYCSNFLFSINFFHQHPSLLNYTTNLWRPLYLFFEVNFIRHFFKAWKHTPKWNKYLAGIAFFQLATRFIALFVGRVLPLTWSNFIWKIDLFSSDIMNFSILITFFIYARKKIQYTSLMILATLPFTLYLTIIRIAGTVYESIGTPTNGVVHTISLWLNKWSNVLNLVSFLWLVIFFTLILFFRYKRLQKENTEQALEKERLALEKETEKNELIARQKIDLEQQVKERTAALNQSLDDLKATQAQLVQSEKMASLGELTAGIAHEIQNPLNFVTNFSEVNKDLISEMKEEMDKGNIKEAMEIAGDIEGNEEKIIFHGRRADAIVKGMLQHSRTKTGQKELTDINALADEFLRLSYHGLRAKDKSFNALMKTDFDEQLSSGEDSNGKINIIPQDIGRVILNLINNAFYAVTEKKNALAIPEVQDTAERPYEPTVSVSTRKLADKVLISVKDNGNGIPQKVLDKIFQPFFTTKPSGEGTGLGLSLSYDIIKAHGGELKVETKVGEGTEFIILLPVV